MGANVEHHFNRGFRLDESRLRKVRDLIESRISKYASPLSLRYRVFRGDSLSYETDSVQDVVNEDNEDWRAITGLELVATEKDVLDFKLSFSRGGTTVKITGKDRDAVFLLFSDLREYIRSEVCAARQPDRDTVRLGTFLLLPMALAGFLYYFLRTMRPDPRLLSKALSAGDLSEKLNYLIDSTARGAPATAAVFWLLTFALLPALALHGGEALWKAVFPANVFLFGKRKATFEKRRRLLGNIFWGIIVALVVSAVAGLLVWQVTRK